MGKPANYENLTTEAKCKIDWENSPDIRAEFFDLENYTHYMKAVKEGVVREWRKK